MTKANMISAIDEYEEIIKNLETIRDKFSHKDPAWFVANLDVLDNIQERKSLKRHLADGHYE